MSRSQITCQNRDCKRPLAERRHSGRIVVYSEVCTILLTPRGVELECPACKARRVMTLPEPDQEAA